jgi:hypothetical protein
MLVHDVRMPGSAQESGGPAPRLRVISGEADQRPQASAEGDRDASSARATMHLVEEVRPLLIAGSNPLRRDALQAELAGTMPEGTAFEQASLLSEVLELAPSSRLVIVSGGLRDISARSLMRILGQRHPTLPVITLDPAGPDAL